MRRMARKLPKPPPTELPKPVALATQISPLKLGHMALSDPLEAAKLYDDGEGNLKSGRQIMEEQLPPQARPAMKPVQYYAPGPPQPALPPPKLKPKVSKAQPFPESLQGALATAWDVLNEAPIKVSLPGGVQTFIQPESHLSLQSHTLQAIKSMAQQGVKLAAVG